MGNHRNRRNQTPQMTQMPHVQNIPLIGRQPSQRQVAEARIVQSFHDMTSKLYVQLATNYIENLDSTLGEGIDAEELGDLARTCRTVATAFFEGLGVIQAQKTQEAEPKAE